MKVYFAHPVTDYGTERQAKALAALRAHFVDDLGRRHFEIENPDQPHHQAGYAEHGMEYFKAIVGECSHLAFMRFPDGGIGAGVGREIRWAHVANLHVYEVFDGRLYPTPDMPNPILTVEETRDKIAALSVPAAAVVGEPVAELNIDLNGVVRYRSGDPVVMVAPSAAPSAPEGWQPIETAPKDGTRFLASVLNDVTVLHWHGGQKKGCWHDENSAFGYGENLPTHWRPLPAPPALGGASHE